MKSRLAVCLPSRAHSHASPRDDSSALLWKRLTVQQSTQNTSQYAIGAGVYSNIPHVTCWHAVANLANSHQACLRHGKQVVPFTNYSHFAFNPNKTRYN